MPLIVLSLLFQTYYQTCFYPSKIVITFIYVIIALYNTRYKN